MDEQILKILRKHSDRFTSAEEISHRICASCSTVARHIHNLREQGYDIQTQPHEGYKLLAVPDRLLAQEIAWQLQTKIIGKTILSYNTVDSTNSVAFGLAEKGAASGTAIFAEAQSKGRGRLGRKWVSPKSTGIYLSLILRPKIAANQAAVITLLAAVSCAEAIRTISGLPALIRWPNDILVNGKKVCGILTEMQAQEDKVKFIVLGIGINVNTPVSKLPEAASSLCAEIKKGPSQLSRIQLARELLQQLDKNYLVFQHQRGANLIRQWKNLSALSGKRVKVFFAHRTIEGQAQDIDEQGALIVRLDSGLKQHLLAGDVVKIR